jgi:hypothetical protein
MSEEQNLRNYISELIREVEQEIDEMNTTANIDGYQTPHAFSRKKDKERRKKNATQLGYSLVNNDVDNITEAITKISSSNFKKLEAGIKKIDPKIKIYLDASAPGGFEIKIPEDNKGKWVSSTDKINALVYKITGDQRNGRIFIEGINEAKQKRPVNRWLELKNDDTMHPHKKMAMGLKELKYQLAETEKFFNWYNKIKTMNELDSQKYWKRTQNHIYKIKERLINIAKTIQEIEK